MCGIVGYRIFQDDPRYKEGLLKAANALIHRGPDNQEVWKANGVGLAHTRLSILDLSSAGNQPMISHNGRYVISFNGQVYNYLEIAERLNIKINKASDTKVILEAITKLGVEKAIPLFNGMFAIAIWDNDSHKLHLIRDSIGIKPIYWALTSEGILFGSELKALLSFESFKNDISQSGLSCYLQHKAIYAPFTIYKDCYKLLPGHILTFDHTGPSIQAYKPKTQDYSHIQTFSNASTQLETLLKDSIQRHTRSDVPFSAFLSGGIDSSLIVSLLAKTSHFKTFSIGYTEKNYDETNYAQKVAQILGVENETIILSPQDVFKTIDNIHNIYDEPFGDASCVPTYLLSHVVARSTKVTFSGDGADELFAGYPRYFNAINQWKRIGWIPYSVRNKLIKKIIPESFNPFFLLANFFLKDPRQSLKYFKKTCDYRDIIDIFLEDNYIGVPDSIYPRKSVLEEDRQVNSTAYTTPLKRLLTYDQQYRLPDEMLTKVDRASMSNSLEVRVPFLDNEIVAFSRTLPDSLVGNKGSEKMLLKHILKNYLPSEVVDREKMGFHVPLKLWLKDYFQEWAQDLLFNSPQFFSLCYEEEVRRLWLSYCEGNSQLFYPIWLIIMHNQWMRKFKI